MKYILIDTAQGQGIYVEKTWQCRMNGLTIETTKNITDAMTFSTEVVAQEYAEKYGVKVLKIGRNHDK